MRVDCRLVNLRYKASLLIKLNMKNFTCHFQTRSIVYSCMVAFVYVVWNTQFRFKSAISDKIVFYLIREIVLSFLYSTHAQVHTSLYGGFPRKTSDFWPFLPHFQLKHPSTKVCTLYGWLYSCIPCVNVPCSLNHFAEQFINCSWILRLPSSSGIFG